MGALSFGHLPTAFIPSGPMGTKISNKYKVQVRQQYAAGLIGKDALQSMENDSYHSVGTCTFYGTANTNQLVFEAMGLMLPGSAFVPVNTKLREKLTALVLVFEDQEEVVRAYQNGQLQQDAVIVVHNSEPAARGMPELHKLMPILGNVMEAGHRIMLATDGRLSGASGKVPSILHLSPESVKGGPLAFIQSGDMIEIDVEKGIIRCLADLSQRAPYQPDLSQALELGYDHLKFFPAEANGGAKALSAISAPLPQLTFCPTGGISTKNVADYLTLNCVATVGGSWMLPADAIAEKNWTKITELSQSAVNFIQELRRK